MTLRPKDALRGYQQRAATHLYEADACQAVIPMGGGKTATELTVIQELIRDGVIRGATILAPKRVAQLVWRQEAARWEHLAGLRFAMVDGTAKRRARELRRLDADVWIVSIDNAKWLADELRTLPKDLPLYGLLAIDELSRFKSPQGKRGEALAALAGRWKIRHGLTGTPRPNGYVDQFMPANILVGPRLFGCRFVDWRARYFMSDYNGYDWTVNPLLEDRLRDEIASFSVTMDDADMPDLPPLTVVDHEVEMPAGAMLAYKEMERDLITKVGEEEIVAENTGVASGKLCQAANGFFYVPDEDLKPTPVHLHDGKIDVLKDLVEAAAGDPVLISYGYREDLARIRELFGDVPFLGAGVSDRQAERYERDWNAGRIPIMALHPASAGHGLNLQESGRQMIMYDLPWSAELYDQVIKRYWRPGQTRHCFLHRIVARGTIDEMRIQRVERKISAQEAFRQYLSRI